MITDIVNMPRNNVRVDSRFQTAIEYLHKNSNLIVRDAMKLADFSSGEQNDKAKYVMVIRLWNKTKKDDFITPPTQSIATVSRQNCEGPMSSVTMSEENDDITHPPALTQKATITRATATAVQLHHVTRMKKKKDYNIALNMRQSCVCTGEREGEYRCLQGALQI
jgi:hypothetical protein